MPPANGVGHVTYVHITSRINPHPVRCYELAWALSLFGVAEACLQLTLQIVNAHPMPQSGRVIHT